MTDRFANPLLYRPGRPLPARVAVIGAGTIGPDIGYYLLSAIPGLELVLVDVDPDALHAASARIEAYVEKGLARDKVTPEQARTVREGLVTTLDYEAIAGADWVLEAATENLELKRDIFARIESIVGDTTLITSNTSSLPAERLFSGLTHPGRSTVTHFFAPAFQNPAVEVIDWSGADPATVEYLRWVFAATGKVPLVTADAVCFMLDRVFDNWCNEAGLMLTVATAPEIDGVAEEFVHAGPFFVLNLAHGNPIIVETNTLQAEVEGDHYRPAPVFGSVDSWLTFPPGGNPAAAPEVAAAVRDRLVGVLLSQSVDIIDREIGSRADLELGCVLALGFRRGPLVLMRNLGDTETERILDRLARERPGMPTPARPPEFYRTFRRHVLVDRVGDVVVLTIRRPQALNALDDEVNRELLEAIVEHEADPDVAGFVITGYGTRAFCAGADIDRFPSMLGDAAASEQYARDCSLLLTHLDSMDKPVVAAVNGMALGGGFELAMRCHGIVAVEDAWFQLPEVTLGIAPGIGALVVPYRRWPGAAARFVSMTRLGSRLAATEAAQLGVVDELVPHPDSLLETATARVHSLAGAVTPIPGGPVELPEWDEADLPEAMLAGLSPEVIAIIENAIRAAAATETLGAALEVGYRAFAATACTEAARQRITEFVSR